MQFQSKAEFVPYIFTKENPVIEWGGNLYTPPVEKRRLHYHNCLEIGYCYEGSGIFMSEKEMVPFYKGDISIIFPGQRHIACSNHEDLSKWHFIMIDHRRMGLMHTLKGFGIKEADFWNQSQFPPVFHQEEQMELALLVRLITEEFLGKKEGYEAIIMSLTDALFSMIYRMERFEFVGNLKIEEELLEALSYISNHLQDKIQIGTLAELSNMSESTFRRKFHESFQKAPLEFIQENRIKLAKRLLEKEDFSIMEISQKAGFDNMSSFLRQFKKYEGCSPSKRKNQKESEIQIDTGKSNC
jgi:AraC-like DNA-binding protein